jgi:ribosomal protein L12E/L44/L45/RPP1/RPP2
LASQGSLFQQLPESGEKSDGGKVLLGRIIGKHCTDGVFLLPDLVLAELDKLHIFTQQPTVASMGKALADAGKIKLDKDGKNRQVVRKMNGKDVRGWLLRQDEVVATTGVVAENRQQEPPATTATTATTENEREKEREKADKSGEKNNNHLDLNEDTECSEERKKINKEISRSGRSSRSIDDIDIDFTATSPLRSDEKVVAPNSIEADLQKAEADAKAKEAHDRELAAKYSKKTKFYPEMADDVPNDMSSPEAEQICTAFRRSLRRGDAPRMDYLVKDTGLDEAIILAYLDGATWIRKDDSSPAGIVVYLPVEAPA